MGCGSLSPTSMVAMGGMLAGQGLAVPTSVSGAANNLASAGPLAAAQGAFNAATSVVGNPLRGLGSFVLPALTGVVPGNLVNQLSGGDVNNLSGQLLQQANGMMAGGIGGFAQILSGSQGFIQSSIDIKGFASAGININFQSLGIGLSAANGAGGIISNGLGIQFGNLPNLGSVVGRLGDLYNMRNMSTFGTPSNMIQNLINKGYANTIGLVDLLEQEGVDVDDLTNPLYESNIRQVMGNITGNDLQAILNVAGVNLPAADRANVTNLLDLMDINKIAPPALTISIRPVGSSTTPSLKNIGDVFSNLGAQFEDATKLDSLVKSVETPNFAGRLNTFHQQNGGVVTPPSIKTLLDDNTASGSFESSAQMPNMKSIMGTISGINNNICNSAATSLTTLEADPDVNTYKKQMQLLEEIAKGTYFGGGNILIDGIDESKRSNLVVISSGTLSAAGFPGSITAGNITQTLETLRPYVESQLTTIKNKPALTQTLNSLNTDYENIAKQLSLERSNLAKAGIDLQVQLPGGVNSNGSGIRYDRTFPTAPLTDWSSEDLFRYWSGLPKVFTGNADYSYDICRGAMYDSAQFLANGNVFIGNVNSWLDSSESEYTAIQWTANVYPFMSNVTFDFSTGICYFKQPNWRAELLADDRPIGYPFGGIPMPPGADPSSLSTKSPIVAGDKSSIINLASSLRDLGKDGPGGTGVASILEAMATDDIYGDAIKLAMMEGRNAERFLSAGIVPTADKIVQSGT